MWEHAQPIRVVDAIDRARFEAEVVPAGEPLVLRGLVAEWPLVIAAGRSAQHGFDELLAHASGQPVEAWFGAPALAGRFGYTDDLSGFNFERRQLSLEELVAYLLATRDQPDAFTAYAGGIPVPRVLPPLRATLPMPLLDANREMLTSLWIGGRSRTAAHWDVPQNLACVVTGRRRFTLFPIEQVGNLYVGPLDVTPAGQAISLVDFSDPDLDRFPKFRDAMNAALVAELDPGDVLYIPSLWWHHVESLDALGMMVNFWWRDGPEWLATPLLTLFHSLLTLRELPERERHAWRALFDHYIFDPEDEPLAHVPVAARGVFGASTPAIRRRLKDMLAGHLR